MKVAVHHEFEPVSDAVKEKKRKKKKKNNSDSGSQETGHSKTEDTVVMVEYKENTEVLTRSEEIQNKSETVADENQYEHKVSSPAGKMKKRKKKQQRTGLQAVLTKKARYDSTPYHKRGLVAKEKVDVSAWGNTFVPQPVLVALAELGFSQPTEIQVISTS